MTTWMRAPGVVWRRSADRRILMGEASEEVVVVEGSGGVIWDLLEVPSEESCLHADLTALFGGSAEVTQAETVAFLAALRDAGMVEVR